MSNMHCRKDCPGLLCDCVEARADKLEAALRVAQHELTFVNGLHACDGFGAYGKAQADGCDCNGAWDVFVDSTFRLDMTRVLTLCDEALKDE